MAIVVEGPDDRAALRPLLSELAPTSKLPARDADDGVTTDGKIRLLIARGKSKLALRVKDAAQGRVERVLLCFDPDADSRKDELQFFEKGFRALALAGEVGPLQAIPTGFAFTHRKRTLNIYPAPWRSKAGKPVLGLPDEHSLERVLLGAILDSHHPKPELAWIESSTRNLMAIVHDHGWKRALRIAGACIAPDAEAFVDALLQRGTTASICRQAIRESDVGLALAKLLA